LVISAIDLRPAEATTYSARVSSNVVLVVLLRKT